MWLTRIDANLPRAALGTDLQLSAADSQARVENRIHAQVDETEACAQVGGIPAGFSFRTLHRVKRKIPGGVVALFLCMLTGAAVVRRRRRVSAG